jgi:uncharacterized protein involved in exopolysaccharide biosynthesis
VSSESLDDYLRRLAFELRERGHRDARMLDEAREHLADAIDAGLRQGLTQADAEREALARFGAPEIIAQHSVAERDDMKNRLVAALDMAWHRKWWILAPTALTALVTSVGSYYYLPTVYRSESVIHVTSPRVQTDAADTAAASRSQQRFQTISQTILSPTRLEWIAKDFGLDKNAETIDAVLQMRRNISVEYTGAGFSVSFASPDPTLAMKVTERLAALFVEENLRDREVQVDSTSRFLEAQIADVRKRLIEVESNLEMLRSQNPRRSLSRADVLPYEVLQERYRDLLVKNEDVRSTAELRKREAGEQFQIAEGARLPRQPIGPSRLGINVAGALTGLGLGVALVVVRGRSTKPRD